MKTIILTEKPSVARDFAQALGLVPRGKFFENNDYIITWALGHLLTLKDPEDYDVKWKKWTLESLPIVPDRISYKANTRTKKQLNNIVSLFKRNDIGDVIVATDAGREGELIARTILSFANAKGKMFRFWTSQALSEKVIKHGLKNLVPLSDYDRLFASGRARQVSDWLVGMNLSRLATLKLGSLFSVGRVQTAVLALIVMRRKEIESFQNKKYFNIKGRFKFDESNLDALWFDPTKKDEASLIESSEKATKYIFDMDGHDAIVTKSNVEEKSVGSPHLYSLTELQKQANRLYGFSAKKTLSLAQELYEKYKCLSYPRTDSEFLGTSSFDQVCELVDTFKNEYSQLFISFNASKVSIANKRVFDDARLTDHHALIPLKKCSAAATSDAGKVFGLVLKRFISAFSNDYVYKDKRVELKVNSHFFKARGLEVLDQGWTNLVQLEKNIQLPSLSLKEVGEVINLEAIEKETRAPMQYSEATLLQDMINPARLVEDRKLKAIFRGDVGLGTQATRAQIIETLLNRNYIKRDGRKLLAEDKGVFLIDAFSKKEVSNQLTRPEETAKWESDLEDIAQGKGNLQNFLRKVNSFTVDSIKEWKASDEVLTFIDKSTTPNNVNSIVKCPKCSGDIFEGKKGFGCSQWKQGCKFVIWKTIAGKKISTTQVKTIIEKGKSSRLKGFTSKAGNKFEATLKLAETGVEFEF